MFIAALVSLSCKGGAGEPTSTVLDELEATTTETLPGLRCEGKVVRVEGGVPHIYAHDRVDAGYLLGFSMAQDRFFYMDLARRLALGRVSAMLGDAALESDMESRSSGMTQVAHTIHDALDDEGLALFEAFAAGVNAYVRGAREGRYPVPSELDFAFALLGAESPEALLEDFSSLDVAAVGATVLFESGYETGDVGRAETEEILPTLFQGAALEALRQEGVYDDIWQLYAPLLPHASASGFGLNEGARSADSSPRRQAPAGLPARMYERLGRHLDRIEARQGHDHEHGFGSNAWAVAGHATSDGRALMAGDGHLPLTVPALLYPFGIDTALLGGGPLHQFGMSIPGMPIMALGTNGDVAWSQTQLSGDITDWYREELQLDDDGLPAATLFQGTWEPVTETVESIEIADVPILDSVGRTETFVRYTTFDGRVLAEIEGRDGEDPGAGEGLVWLFGSPVIPGDTDGDGVVEAISFDYTGFDAGSVLKATEALGLADSVDAFRTASEGLVAYSQSFVAADKHGSVYYTGWQATPCRGYLPRTDDGWDDGAHPGRLLDGTTYGAFEIPIEGGLPVSDASDPYRCVVPFDEYPAEKDPARGYVLTANNDPGGMSLDNNLTNDDWYLGGPWTAGFRDDRIDMLLDDAIENGWADLEGMATIQGDHRSNLASFFLPAMLDALEVAASGDDEVLAALWAEDPEALAEVGERLAAWWDAGVPARSGIETFYASVEEGDLDHAVATTLFNAWFPRFVSATFDDEGFPGVWQPWSTDAKMRTLGRLVAGRDADNSEGLSSWNEATGESAFFDVLGTDEVETSEELLVQALLDALAFLETEASEDDIAAGQGGFGTDDMSAWLWGLRHVAKMESLLGDFLGDDPTYSVMLEPFSINTTVLPLEEGLSDDDPRAGLTWFPRHGDNLGIDAGNPGLGGTRFSYGSGPVMRLVVALDGADTEGINIVPGGTSGLIDSPYFADQAAAWLGNEAWPIRFSPESVVEGAVSLEVYQPGVRGLCSLP